MLWARLRLYLSLHRFELAHPRYVMSPHGTRLARFFELVHLPAYFPNLRLYSPFGHLFGAGPYV